MDVLAYLILCLKIFPILKKSFSFDSKAIHPLLSYGGWVTVSNIVSPILVYLDRFAIGSIISMSAVACYTAPYEAVTRLWIFSSSMAIVLFSAFSTIGTTSKSKEVLVSLYACSIKYLLLIMGLLVIVLILFAEDILHLWIGGEFAEKSTPVIQILAVGILFNSLAQIPFALLQGLRRPDLTAKFHLLELLLYVPLVLFLVKSMGIAGGALAWTLRVMLDALLLFLASWKLYDMNPRILSEHGILRGIGALVLLTVGLAASLLLNQMLWMQVAITAILIVLFALTSWRYVLNTRDREFMISIARNFSKTTNKNFCEVQNEK
jgi:O-antigen/teichoic acid export membrane protein